MKREKNSIKKRTDLDSRPAASKGFKSSPLVKRGRITSVLAGYLTAKTAMYGTRDGCINSANTGQTLRWIGKKKGRKRKEREGKRHKHTKKNMHSHDYKSTSTGERR